MFLVQSNEAINVPPAVRVLQNFRDSESRGEILAIPSGLSINEALEDIAIDRGRQRLYPAALSSGFI
jgi:DNA-binding beta-propeller fold protein YncE